MSIIRLALGAIFLLLSSCAQGNNILAMGSQPVPADSPLEVIELPNVGVGKGFVVKGKLQDPREQWHVNIKLTSETELALKSIEKHLEQAGFSKTTGGSLDNPPYTHLVHYKHEHDPSYWFVTIVAWDLAIVNSEAAEVLYGGSDSIGMTIGLSSREWLDEKLSSELEELKIK